MANVNFATLYGMPTQFNSNTGQVVFNGVTVDSVGNLQAAYDQANEIYRKPLDLDKPIFPPKTWVKQ